MSCGHQWVTSVQGTEKSVREYFMQDDGGRIEITENFVDRIVDVEFFPEGTEIPPYHDPIPLWLFGLTRQLVDWKNSREPELRDVATVVLDQILGCKFSERKDVLLGCLASFRNACDMIEAYVEPENSNGT
jgi:hypothetical protein